MDDHRFDHLARLLGRATTRRRLLAGLAISPLAGPVAARLIADVTARKKRKKKGKNAKQGKPNEFGCLDVGAACKNADQCCSGVCQGKKGKRKCLSHNAGICQPERDYCMGTPAVCKVSGETLSVCWLTTGKAAFCANLGGVGINDFCRDCARDEDCQEEFGPGAACIDVRGGICGDQGACADTGGTACVAAVA